MRGRSVVRPLECLQHCRVRVVDWFSEYAMPRLLLFSVLALATSGSYFVIPSRVCAQEPELVDIDETSGEEIEAAASVDSRDEAKAAGDSNGASDATDSGDETDKSPEKPEMSQAELTSRVSGLIKKLQSNKEADRVSAEKELVALGSRAIGLLPKVTIDTSEEMRARLNRVRRQLQQAAAESAVVGSRVTIKGEMLLSVALDKLQEQTNNRLVDFRDQFDQPRLDPKIELDFKDAAYWTVLESILEQAGLQLYAYTNEPKTLGYIARSDKLTAAAMAAATELFRLEVVRLQAIRDIRDTENQGLVVVVEVTWEPRITPLSIEQALSGLTVTDDKGNELSPLEGRGVTRLSVQEGISSVELELPFELPSRDVQKIALKGKLATAVPGGSMKLEFENLESSREVTKGESGINVVMLRARKNRDLFEIRVLVQLEDASEELRMQRGWLYSNEAYLVDSNGKKVEYAGLEAFRETPEEVGLSYKYDLNSLKGHKLIYESPAAVMNIPVEYEIKDIVLP